jgi:hypothetical protein
MANDLAEKIKDYEGRLKCTGEDELNINVRGYALNNVLSETTVSIIRTIIVAELADTLEKLNAELEAL